jgi:TolB protein
MGEWLLFTSDFNGVSDIYRVRLDGRWFQNLTGAFVHNVSPTWSPDGRWIAFTSDDEGHFELYRMRPDGRDQQRLVTRRQRSISRPGRPMANGSPS